MRVKTFFLELKHGRNGATGVEISKIRHLGPKRRRFDALVAFFFFKLKVQLKTTPFRIS